MKYCSNCGAAVEFVMPPGDDRERFVCPACGTIHYQNPRLVVGCIPEWEDKILFCRRSIEPRAGKWTVPAGFLENGETVAAGAARETLEEACARVVGLAPFALFNLTFVHQIYLMFRGPMADERFAPGHESLEVELFAEPQVPWDEIAFPVIRESLRLYFEDRARGEFQFHMGDIHREPFGK
jgi:ADP-ribose pyrophosphatase YjhB (NUDIX family)